MDPVPDMKPLAPPATEKTTKQELSETTTPQSPYEGMVQCMICSIKL